MSIYIIEYIMRDILMYRLGYFGVCGCMVNRKCDDRKEREREGRGEWFGLILLYTTTKLI